MPHQKIVIFASGSGSNAQAIMQYFSQHATARVAALFSNRTEAFALERARQFGVPASAFSKAEFTSGQVLEQLRWIDPDLIVLAGFLWLVPAEIVAAFPNRIINIHPALLPNYGGKGMHGMHVHHAVVQAGEQQSGLTVHYVNTEYDKGNFILQAFCPVLPADTPETLAARVLELEHFYLPRTIEQLLSANLPAPAES